MITQDLKAEAFAMAAFILQINTLRSLVGKGVLSRPEAIDLVDDARLQLYQLVTANQTDGAAMLDRELLDFEAIFRDIDERAAEDLLRTLRDAMDRILDIDDPVDEIVADTLARDDETLRY